MMKINKQLRKYNDQQLINELERRKKIRENNLIMIIREDFKDQTIKLPKNVKKVKIGDKTFMGDYKVVLFCERKILAKENE